MVLSNTTLSSNLDKDGYRYWSSFDLTSFAKGNRKKAFVGQLNGMGPRCGDLAVVKIFVDKAGTESRCQTEMDKTATAQNLSRAFLENHPTRGESLEFVKLLKALIDDRCMVVPGSRKLQRGEWVLIEEKFDKHFKTFIDHGGRSKCKDATLLEAFVHFSYHYTNGKLVVCGLEGSKCGGCYRLKTPIIHSVAQGYGDSDAGESGISRVLGNHVCNDICRAFMTPNWILDRPQPSAPYEPELQFLFDLERLQYYGQTEQFYDNSSMQLPQYYDNPPLQLPQYYDNPSTQLPQYYDNPSMVYYENNFKTNLQAPPQRMYPEWSPLPCQQCSPMCQSEFNIRPYPLPSHRQA